MHLTIERNGKRFDTTVTPALSERLGVGFAGWDERGADPTGLGGGRISGGKGRAEAGDLLVTVNGQPIHSQIKFQEITKNSNGKPIEIDFLRDGAAACKSRCSRYLPSWTVRRAG